MTPHPNYMGVYCPTCKQDCLPIRGCCGFCDTRVVPASRPKQGEAQTPNQEKRRSEP